MNYKISRVTVGIIVCIIVSTIILSVIVHFTVNDMPPENRIGNEVTITIEIIIGISIALLIHRYSDKRQKDVNETLERIKKMIQRIEIIENEQQVKIKKTDEETVKKKQRGITFYHKANTGKEF